MVNEAYPFSVFYIPYSTFEKAGKKISSGENNKAWDFLFKAVLINLRYKRHLGTSVTFTTKQIMTLTKDIECENKFTGLMTVGENMAEGEEDETIRGTKDDRLLQFANNKNVEVMGEIKVICDDYITKQYFNKAKLEYSYPVEQTGSEEAHEELLEIEKKLKPLVFLMKYH